MARGRISTPVDDDEEQQQSQQQEEEEVDEDMQSSRKRRRPNKGKAPASNSAANGNGNASESEGEALTDDEEAVRAALRGWTLDSFTDKPIQLSKAVQQQMKKMGEQLHLQITLMSKSIGRITDVAAALEDCRSSLRTKSSSSSSKPSKSGGKIVKRQRADSDEEVEAEEGGEQEGEEAAVQDDAEEKRNEEATISLEEKIKQLIDEIKVLECRIKALQQIHAELQENHEMEDIKGEIQRRFVKELGTYPQASDRTKYKNSEYYKTFKQTVWDIRHEDEACPPISTFLEKGPDDPESDDDDIEVGGTTQLFKCPLTLLPFEDAVTRYV
ncbi:hypothetical protein QFC22_001750 [Naganishia vaughanmartiniae]|uniref:Uncharacterized protein n=1 Tax=Naganishia vaughanmartiniae TaxID=1424756 RepID=A0ACC2XFW5_9TREE|nr:hypothetical protein QFC22_001750 [Naganishia vaughanmartiniae]